MEIEISPDGFINALRCAAGGAVVEDLDRELMAGVQAIFDQGGKSVITTKMTIKRIPTMDTAVNITVDVKAVHPQEPPIEKAMFVTAGNGLTDQYQEQQGLPLGKAETPAKPNLTPVTDISQGDQSA